MDKIVSSIVFALYHVLSVLQFAMFVRALMSWIPAFNGSRLAEFLYEITEPFIMPVRRILEKTPLANSMIDISFFITFVLLVTIQDLIIAI